MTPHKNNKLSLFWEKQNDKVSTAEADAGDNMFLMAGECTRGHQKRSSNDVIVIRCTYL